jgi:hypothetical protein
MTVWLFDDAYLIIDAVSGINLKLERELNCVQRLVSCLTERFLFLHCKTDCYILLVKQSFFISRVNTKHKKYFMGKLQSVTPLNGVVYIVSTVF